MKSRIFLPLLALVALLSIVPVIAQAQSNQSLVGGVYVAQNYAYGYGNIPADTVDAGSASTGSYTITLVSGSVQLSDGRQIAPFSTNAPITVGAGATQETVTPSAVSGCTVNGGVDTCLVTATFTYAHGRGTPVRSGSYGLQEAINDANSAGGGTVVVDANWFNLGGSASTITGVTSTTPKVWVEDLQTGAPVWYGKSGTGSAAYSASNNDRTFTVTLSAGAGTKTLSRTYGAAPVCEATDKTAANAVSTQPTTSTVVLAGTTTDVIQVHCDLLP